jgi:Tfp pilus assembly protein PilV
MRTRTHTSGFSIVELAVIVIAVGILGLLGYSLYNNFTSPNTADQSATVQSAQATDVATAPATITTTSDLDKATAILDQTNTSGSNGTDSGQIDSQLTNF